MNGQVTKVKGSGKKQIEPGCEIIIPSKVKKRTNMEWYIGYATSFLFIRDWWFTSICQQLRNNNYILTHYDRTNTKKRQNRNRIIIMMKSQKSI